MVIHVDDLVPGGLSLPEAIASEIALFEEELDAALRSKMGEIRRDGSRVKIFLEKSNGRDEKRGKADDTGWKALALVEQRYAHAGWEVDSSSDSRWLVRVRPR